MKKESGEFKIFPARPATEEIKEPVMKAVCDICGADAFCSDSWNIRNIGVGIVTGYNSPSGGCKETLSYDLCKKCWDEKIVPLFVTGPTESNSDW